MNGLIMQSSWTDPSAKGFVTFVPGLVNIVMGAPLWNQQWIPGRFDKFGVTATEEPLLREVFKTSARVAREVARSW